MTQSLYLDKKSETLKVIQQLRNEAHCIGISSTATEEVRAP